MERRLVRSGVRSSPVEIWRPGDQTTDGEPNPSPTLLKTVFAQVYPLRGRETSDGGERQSYVTYRARFRYFDVEDVTAVMSVRFSGKRFNITAVMPDLMTRKTIDMDLVEQDKGVT
ncbi:MAG: phage head closure protein [Beijerinckiaceae bacterium]